MCLHSQPNIAVSPPLSSKYSILMLYGFFSRINFVEYSVAGCGFQASILISLSIMRLIPSSATTNKVYLQLWSGLIFPDQLILKLLSGKSFGTNTGELGAYALNIGAPVPMSNVQFDKSIFLPSNSSLQTNSQPSIIFSSFLHEFIETTKAIINRLINSRIA